MGLRLSSPPSAAVSGHQWVYFGSKSFHKGLCANTYASCLCLLAVPHPRCAAWGTVVRHSGDTQGAAWRAKGTNGHVLQAHSTQVPITRKGTHACHQKCQRWEGVLPFPGQAFFFPPMESFSPLSAGWFPPCHPSSERLCFCCRGWSWPKAFPILSHKAVLSKWRELCASDLVWSH